MKDGQPLCAALTKNCKYLYFNYTVMNMNVDLQMIQQQIYNTAVLDCHTKDLNNHNKL